MLDGRVRINADNAGPTPKGIYKYWQPKRSDALSNDSSTRTSRLALLAVVLTRFLALCFSLSFSLSLCSLQMMFQVVGSNGVTGMATAEVEKNWRGDHKYNLLSIDLVEGRDPTQAERIILEGDPSYRIYKGVIKLR